MKENWRPWEFCIFKNPESCFKKQGSNISRYDSILEAKPRGSYIRFVEGSVYTIVSGPLFSTYRVTCNRLCVMSWSIFFSYVLHPFSQSGGAEERFLRLQNDRWLAGAPSSSLSLLCHEITPVPATHPWLAFPLSDNPLFFILSEQVVLLLLTKCDTRWCSYNPMEHGPEEAIS
jgi:hypothetical protein